MNKEQNKLSPNNNADISAEVEIINIRENLSKKMDMILDILKEKKKEKKVKK